MRVAVYKNLNASRAAGRTIWSVAQTTATGGSIGKLIHHTDRVALQDVAFVVKETARLRVCARQCREVHAWCVGALAVLPADIALTEVTYNPYRGPHFTTRGGAAVHRAKYVRFSDRAYAAL